MTRLGLEVTKTQMLMLMALAAIAFSAAVLIVSPVLFSLNLLFGCIGLLAQNIRNRGPKSEPGQHDPDP